MIGTELPFEEVDGPEEQRFGLAPFLLHRIDSGQTRQDCRGVLGRKGRLSFSNCEGLLEARFGSAQTVRHGIDNALSFQSACQFDAFGTEVLPAQNDGFVEKRLCAAVPISPVVERGKVHDQDGSDTRIHIRCSLYTQSLFEKLFSLLISSLALNRLGEIPQSGGHPPWRGVFLLLFAQSLSKITFGFCIVAPRKCVFSRRRPDKIVVFSLR